ncbi:hypothetical protein BV25DRAFT_1819394 [Artomyces pyxidatus]|uniref:Uncharacterized protein n=1 Tax=Artomyces pyxidatus TaxID=48021 RepID=A0ACB8THH5_9AGAM|nr:hypothetical protein BV25DRAFT_1819394 [Artomyces pyxidatus]
MDELVHHCIREISFDGDLGCNVSRLHDFIADFFSASHPQVVDDAYLAFVWSVVVRQPTVRVGTVPPGTTTEVYIAPQQSKKKKAKAENEEIPEPAPRTELVIIPDAAKRTFDELRAQYGDELRIAVDPETCFAAITGSHTRPSKLSPMVYTALQFIARGREPGISVVDLGKKTGYDQKACFYLIKQLLDLDLVVKLRQGGVGANFCVLKYYYDRSDLWRQIREEGAEGGSPAGQQQQGDEAVEPDVETEATSSKPAVSFEPIDERHLSSLPLIQSRIVKLLKNSPYGIHQSQNLLVTIGFSNPTKTNRRFFQIRLKELVEKKIVERVLVPNSKKRNSKIPCIRLISADGEAVPESTENVTVVPDSVVAEDLANDEEARDEPDGLKANVTIQKQMIDLLENAGTRGMTLNELSYALCNFDKRTLELLLKRLESSPPPTHLSDYGVAQMMETYGRERRYRFYTVASYRVIVARENLDDHGGAYSFVNFSQVGGFAPLAPTDFYDDPKTVERYVDSLSRVAQPEKKITKEKGSRKRKPKQEVSVDNEGMSVKKPRGKKRKRDDEAEPDGEGEADAVVVPTPKKKRGRPSKVPEPPEELDELPNTPPPPKKRGRQRKQPKAEEADDAQPDAEDGDPSAAITEPGGGAASIEAAGADVESPHSPAPEPKRRGRPPKRKWATAAETTDQEAVAGQVEAPPVEDSSPPKKRGRPRKAALPPESPAPEEPQPVQNSDNLVVPDGANTNSEAAAHTSPEAMEEGDSTLPDDVRPAEISESTAGPSTAIQEAAPTRRSIRKPKAVVRPDFVSLDKPKRRTHAPRSSLAQTVEPSHPAEEESEGREGDVEQTATEPNFSVQTAADNLEAVAAPSSDAAASGPPAEDVDIAFEIQQILQSFDIPIDPSLLVREPSVRAPHDVSAHVKDAHISQDESSQGKRGASVIDSSQQPQQRPRSDGKNKGGRPKGNVSNLRRENELLRVMEDSQGICNTSSKEFLDAHLAVLDAMATAGEPTSGLPGIRVDKRTLDSTLDSMESRGKIKILKTSVILPTGTQRPVRIIYLPNVTEAQLQAFLDQLRRSIPVIAAPQVFKTVVPEISEGPSLSQGPRPAPSLRLMQKDKPSDIWERWNKNKERSKQLFEYDDETIREVLLVEKITLAQYYGFIHGTALRARELHLNSLTAFSSTSPSPQVVSVEQRIISVAYYFEDITIGVFCSLVSTLVHDEELTCLLSTEDGKNTPAKDIPQNIHTALQIGRSRSRARIMDLLDILRSLHLITPLQPSTSENPLVQCAPNGDHPTAFDAFDGDLSTRKGRGDAPVYWRFNTHAPLYLWVLSDTSPPLWKEMSVTTREEAEAFWQDAQRVSRDRTFAESVKCPEPAPATESLTYDVRPARNFQQKSWWNPSYELTWHQRQYLSKFVVYPGGKTPLDDADGGREKLAKICHVVSAPIATVEEFFRKAHGRHRHELEKVRSRTKVVSAEDKAKRVAEEKIMLAHKAADAKAKREKDWEELVRRVHPEPLKGTAATRVTSVRTRYLSSIATKDVSRWEREVRQAIQEAAQVNETLLANAQRPTLQRAPVAIPAPVATGLQGKPVEQLIAEQGPMRNPARPKKKRKRRKQGDDEDDEEPAERGKLRRTRFQWNSQFDELAQDACVIIRARCPPGTRMDWSALHQVFPAVPQNSVRQRFGTQRELPGNDAYLKRLQERWYTLWTQYRGTELLPDPDPKSLTNFDLVKHIQFLRNHVDKIALRVGFLQSHETSSIALPRDISQIQSSWDVISKPAPAPLWDFMWNLVVDEGREKNLVLNAFTTEVDPIPTNSDTSPDKVRLAEAALKMVFGTPNESYDSTRASNLLHQLGEQPVSIAKSNLLARGILSKLVRDPHKSKPGRTMKISEINQNAIGGSVSRDTFQDAATLESLCRDQEEAYREWPLLASDGDLAMLVEAASNGQVNFQVDTTEAKAARPALDFNSKKADDDHIETRILVSFKLSSVPTDEQQSPRATSPTSASEREDAGEHGFTVSDKPGCCKRLSDGIVDCQACLDAEKLVVISRLDNREQEICRQLMKVLQDAGEKGVPKEELLSFPGPMSFDGASVAAVVDQLMDSTPPLVFCAGYSSLVLVSAYYADAWTVTVCETPCARILPRRWLDISGLKVPEIWEAALRAVIGAVVYRPGIAQSEIRWRLRSVYDRQEVADLLRYLHEEGFIKKRVGHAVCMSGMMALSEEEERQTYWFLGDRRWYQG